MELLDQDSGFAVKRVLGIGTEGSTFDCLSNPTEVRVFASDDLAGTFVSFSYYDATCELSVPLEEGEIAVAYGEGHHFCSEMYWVKNVSPEKTKENTLIIQHTMPLKNLTIDLVNLGLSDDVVEWFDGTDWQEFPALIPWIARNVPYEFEVRITAHDDTPVTNARDMYLTINGMEAGDE